MSRGTGSSSIAAFLRACRTPGPSGGIQYVYSATQNNGQITQAVDTLSGENITYSYDTLKRLTGASSAPISGSTPTAWSETESRLRERWRVRHLTRMNASRTYMKLADFDSADIDYMREVTRQELALYDFISGRLDSTDTTSLRGPQVVSGS